MGDDPTGSGSFPTILVEQLRGIIVARLKTRSYKKWFELRLELHEEGTFGPRFIDEHGPDIFFGLRETTNVRIAGQVTPPNDNDPPTQPLSMGLSALAACQGDMNGAEPSAPTFKSGDGACDIMTYITRRQLSERAEPMGAKTCQQRQSYINEQTLTDRGFADEVNVATNTITLDWRPMPEYQQKLGARLRRTLFKVVPDDEMGGCDVALGSDSTKHYAPEEAETRSDPGIALHRGPRPSFSTGSSDDLDEETAVLARLNVATMRELMRQRRANSTSDSAL